MKPEPMPPRRGMAREITRGFATSVITEGAESIFVFVSLIGIQV
jgi:hypothetical protein